MFTDADYSSHRRVALLGLTVAKDLAGGDGLSIINQTVQFNGKQFTVLGILTAKGSTGPQDQDDRVIAIERHLPMIPPGGDRIVQRDGPEAVGLDWIALPDVAVPPATVRQK